jgi:hypothetical protein
MREQNETHVSRSMHFSVKTIPLCAHLRDCATVFKTHAKITEVFCLFIIFMIWDRMMSRVCKKWKCIYNASIVIFASNLQSRVTYGITSESGIHEFNICKQQQSENAPEFVHGVNIPWLSKLYFYVLFNDNISSSEKRRMVRWLQNNELERMRKESVVTLYVARERHLPGGTEENCKNPHWGQPISRSRIESGICRTQCRRAN